jgi:hypothetical protein
MVTSKPISGGGRPDELSEGEDGVGGAALISFFARVGQRMTYRVW